MKTEYKILWIDDYIRSVRGDIRRIESFLKKNEVELDLQTISVNADNKITEQDEFNNYLIDGNLDFLLIDYNMPTLNGVEVIEYIRTDLKDYHTPIVFYSSDNKQNLSALINSKNTGAQFDKYLDGIFFCHREDIASKLINLMESLLKREHKIKAVRGMLMEKVSEIDVAIIEAIKKLYLETDSAKYTKLQRHIVSKFHRKKKQIEKIFSDIEDSSYEESVAYILDNIRITDNHFRSELLREILKGIDALKDNGDVLSGFYNNKDGRLCLNCYRNDYAHKTEKELADIHSEEGNLFIKSESRIHKNNINDILTYKT